MNSLEIHLHSLANEKNPPGVNRGIFNALKNNLGRTNFCAAEIIFFASDGEPNLVLNLVLASQSTHFSG